MQDKIVNNTLDIQEECLFLAELFTENASKIKESEMFESAIALGHPLIAQTISEILAGKYDTKNPKAREDLILLYKNILVFLLLEPEEQKTVRERILALAKTGAESIPGVHDLAGMFNVIDGSHYIMNGKHKEENVA